MRDELKPQIKRLRCHFMNEIKLSICTVVVIVSLLFSVASYGPAAIIQAVIPAVVPSVNKIGNGSKFQIAAAGAVAGDCATFDGGLNISGPGTGAGCGTSAPATPGSTYYTYANSTGTGPDNTAVETSLIGVAATTGSKTIPANTFTAGSLSEFRLVGQITTPAVPDNLTLNMYMGATKVATGTITGTTIASLSAQSFTVKASLFILTGGASCSLVIEEASFITGATTLSGALTKFQGTGTTFNCTASQAFDFKAQWGAAQVGESLFGQGSALYTPGAPVTSVGGSTGAVKLIRSFGASFGSTAAGAPALTAPNVGYVTVPYACTISAWNISVNAGTATVDIWKIATGTAVPTVANTITSAAVPAISSGTSIHSTTLTGWTTAVAANDIFGFNLQAVATATFVNLTVECDQQ